MIIKLKEFINEGFLKGKDTDIAKHILSRAKELNDKGLLRIRDDKNYDSVFKVDDLKVKVGYEDREDYFISVDGKKLDLSIFMKQKFHKFIRLYLKNRKFLSGGGKTKTDIRNKILSNKIKSKEIVKETPIKEPEEIVIDSELKELYDNIKKGNCDVSYQDNEFSTSVMGFDLKLLSSGYIKKLFLDGEEISVSYSFLKNIEDIFIKSLLDKKSSDVKNKIKTFKEIGEDTYNSSKKLGLI